jgi:hypothetical protein
VIAWTAVEKQASATASVFRLLFESKKIELLRRSAWMAISLAALMVGAFLLLVMLYSPTATFLSLIAGIAAQRLGQYWRLKQIRESTGAAQLASFEWDSERVHCSFDDSAVLRYIASWKLRFAASAAASGTCFAIQHLRLPGFGWAPGQIQALHSISASIGIASLCLPVFVGVFFFWAPLPYRHWAEQVKAEIQKRADHSIGKFLVPGEIDGLESGIRILWARLRIDRSGEYRAAITRQLQNRTAEIVLRGEAKPALMNALTELARQDLASLGDAVSIFHRVECRLTAFESLAAHFSDPLRDACAEGLKAELEQLSRLALSRRWTDLQRHAAWIESELDSLHAGLRRHAFSIPAVVLPAGSDPYRLLGVSVDTPTPLIKKLRLRLAQLYHPDVSESIGNSIKMGELNAAYDAVMKDREKESR